jgi:hypothetical protein
LEVSNLDFYDYLCGIIFIATKNSTENFEQEKQAIELASDKGGSVSGWSNRIRRL